MLDNDFKLASAKREWFEKLIEDKINVKDYLKFYIYIYTKDHKTRKDSRRESLKQNQI